MKRSDMWLAGVTSLFSAGYVYSYMQLRSPDPPKKGTWGYEIIKWYLGNAALVGLAYYGFPDLGGSVGSPVDAL